MTLNNKNDKKVMDVSNPGSTKPSESSKNIIIKSKPILKDPMISDNSNVDMDDTISSEEPTGPPELPKTLSRKINIEPIRDNLKENPVDKDQDQLNQDQNADSSLNIVDSQSSQQQEQEQGDSKPVVEETTEDLKENVTPTIKDQDSNIEITNTPEPTDEKNEPPKNDTTTNENASLEPNEEYSNNSLINKKQVNESSEEKLAQLKEQEEQQRQLEIDRMVESKQYFLPINRSQKRKTKHFVIAGIILSLALIAVWLYVASSSGLIKL